MRVKVVRFKDGKFGVRRWRWRWINPSGFEYLGIDSAKNGNFWWWHTPDEHRRTDSEIIAIALKDAFLKKYLLEKEEEEKLKDYGRPV